MNAHQKIEKWLEEHEDRAHELALALLFSSHEVINALEDVGAIALKIGVTSQELIAYTDEPDNVLQQILMLNLAKEAARVGEKILKDRGIEWEPRW